MQTQALELNRGVVTDKNRRLRKSHTLCLYIQTLYSGQEMDGAVK